MGTYIFLTTLLLSGIDDQPEIYWSLLVPIKKPQTAIIKSGDHSPGISTLSIQSKANLMPFTLLTGCHNYFPSLDWQSLDVMMNFWWTPLCLNHFLRTSGCMSWASLSGCFCFHVVSEGLFAHWSPQSCRARPESTWSPTPTEKQCARRSYLWQSWSLMG